MKKYLEDLIRTIKDDIARRETKSPVSTTSSWGQLVKSAHFVCYHSTSCAARFHNQIDFSGAQSEFFSKKAVKQVFVITDLFPFVTVFPYSPLIEREEVFRFLNGIQRILEQMTNDHILQLC